MYKDMIITRRVPCKNCSTPIMRNHPKGVFSYNQTGYCRKCARKLYRANLRKEYRLKYQTQHPGRKWREDKVSL